MPKFVGAFPLLGTLRSPFLTPGCLLRTKELPAHFEALSSLGSLSNPASVPFQVRITLGRSVWLLQNLKAGLVRDLNPGPLAPEARIIPLDQRATPAKALSTLPLQLFPSLLESGLFRSRLAEGPLNWGGETQETQASRGRRRGPLSQDQEGLIPGPQGD